MANHICTIEGCERKHSARGMCKMHYQRWWKHGTSALRTTADRLASGLVRTNRGCLEWIRATNADGYGSVVANGKHVLTHRLAWELANGPIPDGMNVLHHCDNPPCAQTEPTEGYPDGHLFLGTQTDNMADMDAKGRGSNGRTAMTHCLQGHLYDEANTYTTREGWRACRACGRASHGNARKII